MGGCPNDFYDVVEHNVDLADRSALTQRTLRAALATERDPTAHDGKQVENKHGTL